MKTRTKVPMAVVAAALAAGGIAQARECTQATLEGLYVFSAAGFNIIQGAAQPKAVTEFIRFNGDGTVTVAAATANLNGVAFRSPPNGTGSYTVAADCTGTLSITNGPSWNMYVGPGAQQLWLIQTGGRPGDGTGLAVETATRLP